MKKKNLLVLAASLLFVCLQTACNDDKNDPVPVPDEANYVYSTIVGENSYVGTIDKFETISQLSNSNSLVHPKTALLYPYKDYLYVIEIESNEKLFQYRKSGGDLQLVKTLSLPAQSFPRNLTFKNDNEAYLSCGMTDKVLVINTVNLSITKEINLSSYKLDAQCIASPGASIIRDDLLYVALWQLKAPQYPNAGSYMAIIDTKTNEPVKMISTQAATMASSSDPAGDPFVDEKGDIYIYCPGGYGYVPGYKEGFLRIKKWETEFDNSYCFPIAGVNVASIPGNKANYIYQKVYTGNGKVYGYVNVPGAASPVPDFVNDRTMQPVIIDIYNKTVEKLNLEPSVGWSCCIEQSGDKLIWGMVSSEGAGFYIYDYPSRKTEKVVKTTGSPFRIREFK